jgi:hypothetical protein
MAEKRLGFEGALQWLKNGLKVSRDGWKGREKWVQIRAAARHNPSYLEMIYADGTRVPWTPTRCDLLENDWKFVGIGDYLAVPVVLA